MDAELATRPFEPDTSLDAGDKLIPVVECFGPTVQGEGAMIGYQTWFIRFGGCDFRCERCDSLHAVLPELVKKNATYVRQHQLTEYVADRLTDLGVMQSHASVEWITFSGGNPAIWDLTDLVRDLKAMGFKIAVETQGSIWADWLLLCDMVTVSPKGPGMGERFDPAKFDTFIQHLEYDPDYPDMDYCIKVVAFDQRDLEFVVEILERWPEVRSKMFLSVGNVNPPGPAKRDAMEGEVSLPHLRAEMLMSYEQLLQEVMQDPRLGGDVRILPQLHALVWGNKQGV